MNAPPFRETLLTALEFMPRHRARTKRGATLTLDSFLEEGRWLKDLSPSALDLVLMGHRYAHLFQSELRAFQTSPLKPALLEDLLQILFAALLSRDRTGPHVIVNEGVEASKIAFGPQTASFVNAFLRGVLRKLDDLQSRIESHPEVLIGGKLGERWQNHPELLRPLGAALAERPPPGISSFDADGHFARRSIAEFREGKLLQAMDVGSWALMRWVMNSLPTAEVNGQRVSATPAPESALLPTSEVKLRVLDACSAPGGKTLAFWTLSKKHGLNPELVAVEANARRLNLLRNNLKRWKLDDSISSHLHAWGEESSRHTPSSNTAEANEAANSEQTPELLRTPFDLIFADLPCTGSGTLHTRPDLLEVDLTERLEKLARVQENILRDLSGHLSADGELIVSICSVDPEEIANISRLLGKEPDFNSWQAVSESLERGDSEIPAETPLPEGIVGWRLQSAELKL